MRSLDPHGRLHPLDPFADIEVFVRTVEFGSFTKAAQRLRLTPSGVSRILSRLEERLGARLLNRTSRSLSLTAEGADYFERCTRILAELEAANASVARSGHTPQGRLRVELPIVLADYIIGPAIPEFLKKYPEVALDVTVRDALIDPTFEGIDVVVRLAPARDSELAARRLGPARSVLVASPAYLSQHGRPQTLADLREHSCLSYLATSGPLPWRLQENGAELTFSPTGRFFAGSGNLLARAALAGLGIAQTFEFHILEELARGNLVVLLEEHEPEPRVIQALFARQKAAIPKVRAFIDFLVELFAALEERKKPPKRR